MSSYTHTSSNISKIYNNRQKGHKLEVLILVGETNRSLRRQGVEVPVYYFFCGYFVDAEFLALRCYIHVVGEGPEECIFDHTEETAWGRYVIQRIHSTESYNWINGSDEEGNLHVLPSGKITNSTEEDIAVICWTVITIDDDNYSVPYNVTEHKEKN